MIFVLKKGLQFCVKLSKKRIRQLTLVFAFLSSQFTFFINIVCCEANRIDFSLTFGQSFFFKLCSVSRFIPFFSVFLFVMFFPGN